MGRLSSIVLVFLLAAVSVASSRTWYVEPGGGGDATTIEAGIDSASAGDTVTVACGTYHEYGLMLKSGVYLTSETGSADCVTITSEPFYRIMTSEFDDSSTHLVGFTLREGFTYRENGAGLLTWQSDLRVANCVFESNQAQGDGGGVSVHQGFPVFTNCLFKDNEALSPAAYPDREDGGACHSYQGNPTFVDCAFLDNSAIDGGGACAVYESSHATFDHCQFFRNSCAEAGGQRGGAIHVYDGSSAELLNCTFVENSGLSVSPYSSVVFSSNSSGTLGNSIIAFNPLGFPLEWDGTGTEPVLECCDLYGNHGGDWTGPFADQYGIAGNISEDPLFCDRETGHLYLCLGSPCLDADTCGTIGAFGLGCSTAVDVWADVTTDTLGDTGWGQGLAWVDYDSDGDLDIFVTNKTGEDRLYRNDDLTPTGFVEATPAILADPGNCRGAAWGDYDNDGDLDLYVSRYGANKLYRNDGGGVFVDVTAVPLDDSGTGQTVSWADYDNDGDVDLYLVNNGANKLFRNDGVGIFTDVTTGPLGDTLFGTGSGWADYDNDGDLDIYVVNYSGPNVLLENQGPAGFVDATPPALELSGNLSMGVAWGDYDNDDDLDLYASGLDGNNLFRNDYGVFVDVTDYLPAPTFTGRSAMWGDYDLDGDLDLYVVKPSGGNTLFMNDNGYLRVPGCGSSVPDDAGDGYSTAWADYDEDGDPDLYVVNNGANVLYRNDPDSSRRWLEVRLVGVVSNSYGQGARIRIVAGGTSQMREIGGASGYLSQGPLTAMFGLGDAIAVDTVEVKWPGRGTQVLTSVACDQKLEIVEEVAGRTDDDAPTLLRLHPNSPNPFSHCTVIRYDVPNAAKVDLAVYDVRGRLIRKLIDGRLTRPGSHQAYWNGLDSSGQPVAPGVYFCRLRAATHARLQRVVLLR